MLKFTVALVLCSRVSALQVKTDPALPLCHGTDFLALQGHWAKLNQKEFDANFKAPGKQMGCEANLKVWQPGTCNLPKKADEITEKPRRTIFIGDSVMDVSAESFAWFLSKQTPNKNCSYSKDGMKAKLVNAGYSDTTSTHTVEWIDRQLTKGHRWWGCNDAVSYIPMHRMPDSHSTEMVKALMFAVKNFGEQPLNSEDALVMNWGLHYTNTKKADEPKSVESLKLILDEWAKWDKAGDAPKLIWRQVSPQHWGGMDGTYSPMHNNDATCAPIGGNRKRLDLIVKRTDSFKNKNDKMFNDAMQKANLKVDGVKIAVLPIWRASAELNEDHVGRTFEHATPDCTHFCTHGPVQRLWNTGLLTLYQGMKTEAK